LEIVRAFAVSAQCLADIHDVSSLAAAPVQNLNAQTPQIIISSHPTFD
jgi:hypothetical protein